MLKKLFLESHLREYLFEALGTLILVFSACLGRVVLWYPELPIAHWVTSLPFIQRLLMGGWMALTIVFVVYCHLGKSSGAHYNPAVTLTFLRLGKVHLRDAGFYIGFQFLGAIVGVLLASLVASGGLNHDSVNYAVTQPGEFGAIAALAGEVAIAFATMSVILFATNHARVRQFTGLFVAVLVAVYLTIESPFSGSSMNPARSFATAAVGNIWNGLWVYFLAPAVGMLAAAELFLALRGKDAIRCAKLYHTSDVRCIFKCGYQTETEMAKMHETTERQIDDQ